MKYAPFRGVHANVWTMQSRTTRECRHARGLSQHAFAEKLGVSPETYRVWDSGRREPPGHMISRARSLVEYETNDEFLPLAVLAQLVNVHVRTLRAAAREGRLRVQHDTRTTFRSLCARAARREAETFRSIYYRRRVQRPSRPRALEWADVPGTVRRIQAAARTSDRLRRID